MVGWNKSKVGKIHVKVSFQNRKGGNRVVMNRRAEIYILAGKNNRK